jgi:hypothetical protein
MAVVKSMGELYKMANYTAGIKVYCKRKSNPIYLATREAC